MGTRDLTSGAVARICGVSPRTVAYWCDTGRLVSYRLPPGEHRRIAPADLADFARRHFAGARLREILDDLGEGETP